MPLIQEKGKIAEKDDSFFISIRPKVAVSYISNRQIDE